MTVEVHSDWGTGGFERPPIADAIGPFAGRAMQKTWWDIRGAGELLFLEGPDALLPMTQSGNTINLLGEADLFDYHSPLGEGVGKLVATWAAGLPPGIELDFDSLPAEAADALMAGLTEAGLSPVAAVHQSAAVLDLPDDFATYLAALDKKQRHETRRKIRRFTEMLGAPRLLRDHGPDAVGRFAAMHRLAAGDKGSFMDQSMETLFSGLHHRAGAVVDFLHGDGEEPVAAAFGFEDASAYYLYNSAYSPEASAASPGIVLVAELIRQATEVPHDRFDFLKGDEVYKYRLGAVARPLWRITVSTGSGSP
jgi:CelD/BcsL family acetyltransferase involved in cellulose biosynthesis